MFGVFRRKSLNWEVGKQLEDLDRSILNAELDLITHTHHLEGLRAKRAHLQSWQSGTEVRSLDSDVRRVRDAQRTS